MKTKIADIENSYLEHQKLLKNNDKMPQILYSQLWKQKGKFEKNMAAVLFSLFTSQQFF